MIYQLKKIKTLSLKKIKTLSFLICFIFPLLKGMNTMKNWKIIAIFIFIINLLCLEILIYILFLLKLFFKERSISSFIQ